MSSDQYDVPEEPKKVEPVEEYVIQKEEEGNFGQTMFEERHGNSFTESNIASPTGQKEEETKDIEEEELEATEVRLKQTLSPITESPM